MDITYELWAIQLEGNGWGKEGIKVQNKKTKQNKGKIIKFLHSKIEELHKF